MTFLSQRAGPGCRLYFPYSHYAKILYLLHFDSTHLLLGVWSQASKNSSDDSDETDGNLAPEGNLAPDG